MKSLYELNKNTYNSIAKPYADNAFKKLWMKDHINDLSKTINFGDHVLDLGCGPGNDSYQFIEKGFKVTGVDISENMIMEARRRVPKGKFIVADMTEVMFEDEYFDAVWSIGSLHHLDREDFKLVIKKMYGWLKNNGKGFISTKSGIGEGIENQFQVGVGSQGEKYWVYWRKEDLLNVFGSTGFTVSKITETEPMRKRDLPEGFTERWLNVWFEKHQTY